MSRLFLMNVKVAIKWVTDWLVGLKWLIYGSYPTGIANLSYACLWFMKPSAELLSGCSFDIFCFACNQFNFLLTILFSLSQTGIFNNRIPDSEGPFASRPTINNDIKHNEVGRRGEPKQDDDQPSNVLMTHAGEDNLLNNTEVLAGEETVWFVCNSDSLICRVNTNNKYCQAKFE